jgi:beta-glucosidase
MSTFSRDFLWGTATAAHQVEGSNVNSDFWVLETAPGSIFAEPSGDACDHYHRYADDIRLLSELGFNLYRFSVEWARIEPEDGMFSAAEIAHYRRVLECCHANGITPMVTLHHFTSPRWTMRLGGWESPDIVGRFARYAERVARDLGDLVPYWCTINEANLPKLLAVMMSTQQAAAHDSAPSAPVGAEPMLRDPRSTPWWQECARCMGVAAEQLNPFLFSTSPAATKNVCEAHAAAREALRRARLDARVGITLALVDVQSRGGDEAARRIWDDLLYSYAPYLRGDDFLGVQNYSRVLLGPNGPLPPELELTQMGYEFYPEALAGVLRETHKLGLPLIVTENGVATDDDARRVEFIDRALAGVEACLGEGIDVRGYTYWSALDNYEWMMGYKMRFGLISVDRATQQRTVKHSARHLGAIARSARGS